MSRSYKRAVTINRANVKSFAHRLAVEIDTMRGKIMDNKRERLARGDWVAKTEPLDLACIALYRAHVALLEAQAELMGK